MKAYLESTFSSDKIIEFTNSDFYKKRYLSSFNFSPSSLSYYQEYFGPDYTNQSILVYDNEYPVLALVAYSKTKRLTHFSGAISIVEGYFETQEKKQTAYRTLILRLNELIKSEQYEEMYFYSNEFLTAEYYSKINESEIEFSSVIELEISKELIQTNIRKSYKSLVNWGKKNLDVQLMKSENASLEVFNTFRDFHIKVAGKKTRSDETWQKQFVAIQSNEAFLVMAYMQNQLVSCSFIMVGKDIAYYGVGVYNRELMAQNLPIAHYNILTSILTAKDFNCTIFDLGFINENNDSDKEINIFKFKSGFTNQLLSRNKFLAKFI
jgi:hypothetical protein